MEEDPERRNRERSIRKKENVLLSEVIFSKEVIQLEPKKEETPQNCLEIKQNQLLFYINSFKPTSD
jgi:hypothetical protein